MPRVILLTDFGEAYSQSLLKGIVQYSKEHEPWVLCKMPLSYRDVNEIEGVLEWAKRWQADGIIAQFYNTDNVSIFKEAGIAAIAQEFKERFTEIPNIKGANHLAGKIGADYFIKKGFKHFAFYGFKGIVWSEERCEGFKNELESQGIKKHYHEYQNNSIRDLWYYESGPLVEWLRSLPKPIAIMACDDNQGHHIAEVCKLCGIKIPEDIAILGVDNDESICTLCDPPLSSIGQAVEKGGYDAAKLLESMIRNKDKEHEDVVVYPTHITTRQSTDIYATNDHYIAVVLRYIHQQSDKKLNVDNIAKLVPLSRRLLEYRFKEVTGSPIYKYIFDLRMERFAQKLLETGNLVSETALECGFPDYKNISRQFKAAKGCTPSEYREIHTIQR